MIRHINPGRLVILAAVAAVVSFASAPRAFAGDAVHYQRGVAHEVILDTTHVLVLTDGSKTSVDLAVPCPPLIARIGYGPRGHI